MIGNFYGTGEIGESFILYPKPPPSLHTHNTCRIVGFLSLSLINFVKEIVTFSPKQPKNLTPIQHFVKDVNNQLYFRIFYNL